MSIETAIQNLADAIYALAASNKTTTTPEPFEVAKPLYETVAELREIATEKSPRGRGRPRKTEPADPVVRSTPVAAVEVAPPPPDGFVVVPAGNGGGAASPITVTQDECRKALIELVKRKGKETCLELCQRYGGNNLSALDPAVYGRLLVDAQAALV
jgi:hypothetical protein